MKPGQLLFVAALQRRRGVDRQFRAVARGEVRLVLGRLVLHLRIYVRREAILARLLQAAPAQT